MSDTSPPSTPPDLDPQLVGDFLDEAQEILPEMASGLIELESKPGDDALLHRIFRGMHTIKGNAAFLGFRRIRNLAHKMEDLLGNLREGKVQCTQESIDTLLAGLDELRTILGRVAEAKPHVAPERLTRFDALLSRLQSAAQPLVPAPDIYIRVLNQVEGLRGQVTANELEAGEALEWLRSLLIREIPEEVLANARKQEADPRVRMGKLLNPAFEGRLAEDKTRQVLECLEELHWNLGSGPGSNLVQEALAAYHAQVYTVGFEPELRDQLLAMLDQLHTLENSASQSLVPEAPEAPASNEAGGGQPAEAAPTTHRTMRVEEHKIDEFLDYVGELIITREMFGNIGKRLRARNDLTHLSSEFQRAMEAFTGLSHSLQHSIMEVRKLPMKVALQRAPRIVRDLAHELGKDAQVQLIGTEVSVDKSLIESFDGPLTHMLRNAVDHGLETTDAREAAGKPAIGTIRIEVEDTPDTIVVQIKDDGRGIDSSVLRQVAVRRGLLDAHAAEQLSEREALRLLFAPGFSTAQVVTDVSGRGVGMDVVARNVEQLGGSVDIETQLGRGTCFTVNLPKTVTVQIVDGFLVRVAGQRLLMPLASISESFRPTAEEVYTVAERGECVHRRGRVIPLLRLAELLKLADQYTHPDQGIVVSVQVSRGQTAGVLVDEVLGVQQVVVREISGVSNEAEIFSGGAVLGDGRIAMVLDVDRLSDLLAGRQPMAPPPQAAKPAEAVASVA